MVCALGLLLAFFRQIERWLHQHIFKVGWLVTNSFQTTTVLYYILFLPGILLHEFTVWVVAQLLWVRAERAICFPKQQEIGELRLNFIRISRQAGAVRYALIRFAPLPTGMVCLWMIAAHVFRLHESAVLSPVGSIDELAQAVIGLTRTADFWLWFYVAFTVANTMFISHSARLSARRKSAMVLGLTAAIFFAWRVGGTIDSTIAHGIEVLVGSLILVLLQVISFNIVVVIGLGALEALIERISGNSAAFTDGKMIIMTRQEAQEHKRVQARKRLASRQQQRVGKHAEVIRSVYDLKLPIPGPPGREPVSRNVVSVVTASESPVRASPCAETIADALIAPPRATISLEQSASVRPERSERKTAAIATSKNQDSSATARPPATVIGRQMDELTDDFAPFSRPFAKASTGRQVDDDKTEKGDTQASGEFFPRPFSMKTRANGEPNSGDISPANSGRSSAADSDGQGHDRQPRFQARMTRPAPKPSSRAASNESASTLPSNDELTYEPLDDEDVFADDEED